MRARVAVAAIASVLAALFAHALDASGRLPFVHESGDVRHAMGPLAIIVWLALTAVVIGLAASSRRPKLLGPAASLASAALPELIGRHDIGALLEPSAMLGAVLQWLLLLVVLAVAVAASRVLRIAPLVAHSPAVRLTSTALRIVRPHVADRWRLHSRAPPRCPSP